MSYKITRFYADDEHGSRLIKVGLTLDEAQAHCQSPESSSSTCSDPTHENEFGPWFDGYDEETGSDEEAFVAANQRRETC